MKDLNDKKLKVCAYVRVSTRSEAQKHSFDEQVDYWTKELSSKSNYDFVKVYSDYGYSGKINNRPSYSRMIKDALAGDIDLIFCKSVSRFGRNIITLLDDIHKLRDNEIYVYFENENISTKDNEKDLYLSIYSAIAEDELNTTSNSIKFGLKRKFESGSPICKPILGYDVKKNGIDYDFTIIPEQAKSVRVIFELYNLGKSFTEISKYLNENNFINKYGNTLWHPPMIPYILANEKYTGNVFIQKYYNENFKVVHNDIDSPDVTMYAIENHHEEIIPLDVFMLAKERLQQRTKRKITKRNTIDDFIQEILFCVFCGNNYKYIKRKNYKGEVVITYRFGKTRYKGECCHNNTIYPDTFKKAFIRAYNKFAKIKNISNIEVAELNKIIEGKHSDINDLIKQDFVSTYSVSNLINSLHKEIDELEFKRDSLIGHVINGKQITYKTTVYNENLAKNVLDKVFVNKNKFQFNFKNGVKIEEEFTNTTPGRQLKE